ncbi:S8 family serine peptidase [Streptomyces sp. KS 21]|uniref:S8 family serine peptidase n=1 Tax=Streptomyces sp. KS 21 TaxID=2485150 RepID=UPI001064053E|nr:S8 family serine peptidase [Streptomyces sp. KS 21]TDU73476.1 subtilase family protein [Streptomyces sp. KS 21]
MRVIAYFMHEHEEHAALNILGNPTATDSYVIGDIAESGIPQLESAGLTIGRLDDVRSETSAMARGRLTGRSAAEADGDAEALAVAPGDRASWIVQLGEPLLERYREEIASTGVELQRSVPVNAYIAAATECQAGQLANLDFVVSVDRYGPQVGAPVRLRAGESPAPPTAGEPKTATDGRVWDLRLAETPGARESVMSWLENHEASSGLRLVAAASHRIRLKIPEGSPLEMEIPQLPDVLDMVEYVPPKLCNDLAVRLMGIVPDGAGSSGVPFTGKGQIVGVADTGLDQTHPDFQGRIVGVVALGRPGDSDDPDGHGTHVAGSVLGDGSASQGQIRGAAPEAKLYFQSIMDAAGNLGGLPLSLADLFEPAYQAGARIHSNSWGAATRSAYTIDSDDVDSYVHQRRDMLVVIAAGNEGTAGVRLNSLKGFVDWASIGSPGSCKNALTVGAGRSNRTSGGFSQATYNSLWPGDYPDPPIGAERVSGDPESLAAFSSRGPCDDFRIKPDLMAPGTDILSTRSSLAPSNHFWGTPHPQNPRYAYMGGTSMATPLVSGCAALVREYYVDRRGAEPSAALVKATLINGARTLSGPDSTAKDPHYHQGFGAIHMPATLPLDGAADFELEFVDTWQKPAKQFRRTGERQRFNVTAGSATPFRLCLAYTDLPGRGLQNDISVIVQAPDGTKHAGNTGLPNPLIGSDCTNNVEVVRIDAPPAGTYLIQVFARNLLAGPQDFALVVTGDLNGPIAQLAN